MRRGAKPAKTKVEAKLSAARKSRESDDSRVHDLEKRLAEALEREKATGEILRVIGISSTDIQPVFATVAETAARLCKASDASIFRLDGDRLRRVAHHGSIPAGVVGEFSLPLVRGSFAGRSVLDGRIVHVADGQMEADEFPEGSEQARRLGFRALLGIPLIREGVAIGVITLRDIEVRLFTDRQVTLLQTFADQAVIAIENVRLFTELQEKNQALTQAHAKVSESLEQQTATSEILRVISQSPADIQPVFDTIVHSARRLLGALTATMTTVIGDELHVAALTSTDEAADQQLRAFYPQQISGSSVHARAARTRVPVNIGDTEQDAQMTVAGRNVARARGYRSMLVVPILREGQAEGSIGLTRAQPGEFTPNEVALLQTFADQAVIAIENVRLFKELEGRNAELAQALDQQIATGEILRVISRSPTDVQPVFDTIVGNAVRLCGGLHGGVYTLDDEMIHARANDGYTPEQLEHWRSTFPRPATDGSVVAKAIRSNSVVLIDDLETAPVFEVNRETLANLRARGSRSLLAVPMSRHNEVIGAIALAHGRVGAFSDTHVELLKTFADQAVIALENVRLFKELQASNSELKTALDKQTATSDILRVISRSQMSVQPVFDAIVVSAVRLLRAYMGTLTWVAGQQIELGAFTSSDAAGDRAVTASYPRPLHSAGTHGIAIRDRAPVNIANALTDPRVPEYGRTNARVLGFQSFVAVPLLRHEQAIGTIGVSRREPGGFTEDEIALLQTFADQAVIAIENVRLFKEIEDKSRQLEVASQHKSEFLANMSHELRTPLNAIIGFSEVLSERMFGDLNEKQEEYLKDIYASGTHLLSLINDILDLSKIEAGRMELELTDFDLPTAIENALTLVRERAGRRSLTLQTAIDTELGQVRADERKIRQVVLNLLSNAIKFTPEGGRIDVAAVPRDGAIEVAVTDTGVGIAPEDQEAVFEEFRQVGTADKKVEGTGLGLTLCRKFVELHGGKIWVKSQLGAGSTFTFTVPVRRGD